jgi:hypothetical protein
MSDLFPYAFEIKLPSPIFTQVYLIHPKCQWANMQIKARTKHDMDNRRIVTRLNIALLFYATCYKKII